MNVQRLVWIGSIVPDEYYMQLCSMGYKNQQASRIAQLNIVQGLEDHYKAHFDYVSGPALSAYPRFPLLKVPSYSWNSENGSHGECASYLNVEYINRLSKANAMRRSARNLINIYSKNDEITVFVNSPHTPFIKAGIEIKKKFPKAQLIMIIPDLPQYMESNVSLLKKFLKSIDISFMMKQMQRFNYYVLYSSKMQEFLGLAPEKCVTMEGCVSKDKLKFSKNTDKHSFTFMYSGTTDEKFGLKLLADAFMSIQERDCRLVITGKGDAANYLEECMQRDSRISYLGFVDDYYMVKQMQADADVLMNMRLPSEPASNYCFPSKLFEYMKTGNPVMSFKIGGIPEEYYEHLLMVGEETTESLKEAMKKAMTMSAEFRSSFGESAKKFILESKDVSIQTEHILNLIKGN